MSNQAKYDEELYGNHKSSHLGSDVRDVVVRTFDNLLDDDELWVSSNGANVIRSKTYTISNGINCRYYD